MGLLSLFSTSSSLGGSGERGISRHDSSVRRVEGSKKSAGDEELQASLSSSEASDATDADRGDAEEAKSFDLEPPTLLLEKNRLNLLLSEVRSSSPPPELDGAPKKDCVTGND